MSVINTMLRNLDERRGTASDLTLMGDVIASPQVRVPPVRATIVILPLMLAALVFGTLYFWPRNQGGFLPKPILIDTGTTPTLPVTESVSKTAARPAQADAQLPAVSLAADTQAALRETPTAEPLDLLALATRLEHADSISPARPTGKPARRPATENAPVASAAPVQQSLPAVPVVAAVTPSATPTIRVEQSTQTASERNLAEMQHAADLQRRGALPEAEASLRGVLDNDKSMIAARLALFSLLSRQQRNDEARKLLKDGVDIAPTQPQLLLPYTRLLAARSDWSAALDALMPATDALAQNAEYRALNAAVLQRLGRFSQSSAEYRAALRLTPAAGAWWVGLGLSLEGEGKQVEARSAYLQARANTLGPDLAQFVDNKLARLGTSD
ncbi:MAG: hypothetical protein JWN23_1872 [Rhodocyclales bacterium]|nr:hypothetical protein [Rhodocyclales bacterium]